jgi:hypothetical protein
VKKYTVCTNREIGKLFGGVSGFAVAKAYQRLVAKLKEDTLLKKEMGWFEDNLSRVKG